VRTIQRTLIECRKLGWPAAIVEKWIPQTGRRHDMFGLVDVVALNVTARLVLNIQACGLSGDAAAHVRKALASPHLVPLLQCAAFEIWAWRKVGARGKRKLWARRTLKFCIDPQGAATFYEVPDGNSPAL
jgi:hypothetical protein